MQHVSGQHPTWLALFPNAHTHCSVALANGHVRIVQASILGSVLVNLLLILGSALLACGVADVEASYSTSGTEVLGCLLFVSVFAFLIPVSLIFLRIQSLIRPCFSSVDNDADRI